MAVRLKRKLQTIKALLKNVETRFRSLTTTELCACAKRAKITQTELEDVKGTVRRVTIVNILMRRYAFGVFNVLFKTIPMDVFRYILQFFDTDINLQLRIDNYVNKEVEECKKDYERAKILRSRVATNAILYAEFHEIALYTGIKRCVMVWINNLEHHRTAFYQFHKKQNSKMRDFLEPMKEKKEEAKQEAKRTRDRQVYNQKMARYTMELAEMTALISKDSADWLRDYARDNFIESLQMLIDHPELLD
jgi:glycogen debranching enzyme